MQARSCEDRTSLVLLCRHGIGVFIYTLRGFNVVEAEARQVNGQCNYIVYTSWMIKVSKTTCISHDTIQSTLLPGNQSFYRQITTQEKDGAVSGVGQW